MLKRYLLLLAIVIPCSSPLFSQPDREAPGFYMRNFFVSIDKSSIQMDGRSIPKGRWRGPQSPLDYTQRVFSGKGSIRIHNKKVPVVFKDVRLSRSPQKRIFKAVSGVVNGRKSRFLGLFGRRRIAYSLGDFKILIDILSINITVNSAVAAVTVGLYTPTFYTDMANSPILRSQSCYIEPNGAIEGKNFHGRTTFELKDTVYRLELRQSDDQFVRLGKFLSGQIVRRGILLQGIPNPIIEIKGVATRNDIRLFSFSGSIEPDHKEAVFSLNLLGPLERFPEPDYVLTLHSGSVEYQYNSSGLELCEGSFNADLKLPETIWTEDNNNIELENIILKTDQTGILFNNVTVVEKIKTGYATHRDNSIFLIEPKKESAWIYFPVWHTTQHSSYYIKETNPCKDHYQFLEQPNRPTDNELELNAQRRPGLTILQGILYFTAPQASFDGSMPGGLYNLKTPFWGAMTCTPWGITGTLTSSGYSFIPSNRDIDESSLPVESKQYTLREIIDLGNNRPPEPEERFSLSGFRILEMHANSLRLCQNKLDGSSFRYTIHFPFPSFIDLEFEDKTLNIAGKFRRALGPIAPFSFEFEQQPDPAEIEKLTEILPKYAKVLHNPVIGLLFAWRLPVAFSNRSVVIDYKEPPLKTVARILMKQFNLGDEKIVSNELKIIPLYSKHSDLKFGLRFKGILNIEGRFTLLDWDKEPIFAKIYPTAGREKTMGFPIQALDIHLANELSNPVTREFDFRWDGEIQFPFFSWQNSDFLIKDLVPKKISPVSLSGEGVGCDEDDSESQIGLELQISYLKYTYDSLTAFTSRNVEAYEIDDGERRNLEAISLEISSYLNGIVLLESGPETVIINDNTILEDAIRSTSIIDLVCYDSTALDTRRSYGIPGGCCEEYYIGTCIVKKLPDKIIMSAPNTKYYPGVSPVVLELNASDMALLSDDSEQPEYETVINIPSAQLAFNEDGMIEGAFGATYTPVAMMLPYEGEVRFFLDPHDGYFYLQIAGSFTFYLRFRGEVFIVHAPYERLLAPPPFFGVTNILNDLSLRALFTSVEEFKDVVEFDGLSDGTIITGFLTAGNAQAGFDIRVLSLQIASGPGVYAFKFKDDDDSGYAAGTFLNTIASARLLIFSLNSSNTLEGGLTPGEFSVSGRFELSGCATALLFHCEAGVVGDAEFSSESGFDFSGCTACAHCRDGGCSGCD